MHVSVWFLTGALLAGCSDDFATGTAPASDATTTIATIQGIGMVSPLAGRRVSVRAVVSGDFQDNDAVHNSNLGGFYLQSLQSDDDFRSSEGLFVFDRNAAGPDVQVGDIVRATGIVTERFGETQLTAETFAKVGTASPVSVTLELPAGSTASNSDNLPIADLERFEGMRVRLAQPLYVQDLRGLERFGEVQLSTEPREFLFTERTRPDRAAFDDHQALVAARTVLLDDGDARQNRRPVRYIGALSQELRAPRVGDAVTDLQAVLRFSRGSGPDGFEGWRLMPVARPVFEVRNPRLPAAEVSGNVIVASFNVLNYFSRPDDGTPRCGPQQSDGCRGADSAAEFARQRSKIAAAIVGLGADIVGLMELENNTSASIRDLADALNTRSDGWSYIDTGVIGADAIRVALVYRHDAVTPTGEFAILDSRIDAGFDDRRNRPALAQTFRAADNGGQFTLAVNHLKSKGSPCDEDGDPDRGDGQGNCNRARTNAATALAKWLASDPTGSGDPDVLIIGDLNAYQREDPLTALTDNGYVNLLARVAGDNAWSFVFRGQSGALDHALATASLTEQVSDVAEWHINADEAPLYDYNLEFNRDPALFQASEPWRASDHDPLLIGLSLVP